MSRQTIIACVIGASTLAAPDSLAAPPSTSPRPVVASNSPRPVVALPARRMPAAVQEDDTKPAEPHDAVRVGALAGVGFPRPLVFEGMVKIADWVGVGGEYATLPTMKFGDVDAKLASYSADARVFPFRGAFFLGLRGGYQRFDAATTVAIPTAGASEYTATVSTWYLNPRLGLLLTTSMGLTIGTEVGVQLPVSSKLSTSAPAELAGLVGEHPAIRFFGGTMPTVDLLRVGGLF